MPSERCRRRGWHSSAYPARKPDSDQGGDILQDPCLGMPDRRTSRRGRDLEALRFPFGIAPQRPRTRHRSSFPRTTQCMPRWSRCTDAMGESRRQPLGVERRTADRPSHPQRSASTRGEERKQTSIRRGWSPLEPSGCTPPERAPNQSRKVGASSRILDLLVDTSVRKGILATSSARVSASLSSNGRSPSSWAHRSPCASPPSLRCRVPAKGLF